MRLSKTTSYAIRILLDCALSNGALVKVADISERQDVTLQNTFKIVHLLSRAGFVQSVRGRHGGVRLARPAGEIRIGDVVREMEHLRHEVEPDGGEDIPGVLDQLFDNALDAFISVLDSHTLEEMANVKAKANAPAAGKRKQARPEKRTRTAVARPRRQQPGAG